jgi:hypothetical protein
VIDTPKAKSFQPVVQHLHGGKMSEPIISLIGTSIRPDRYWRMAECWARRADNPGIVEHCLTYVPSVFEGVTLRSPFPHFKHAPDRDSGDPVRPSLVQATNKAAAFSTGKFLVLTCDDLFPPRHWDTDVLSAVGDLDRQAVLWVRNVVYISQGMITLWHHLICQPMMTRAYYQRYGYFVPPWYLARYTDMEFTVQAQRDNVIVDAREKMFFEHQDAHPAYEPDDTYREAWANRVKPQDTFDEATYHARAAKNFPRQWDIPTLAGWDSAAPAQTEAK